MFEERMLFLLKLYSSLIVLSVIWGASFLFNELLLDEINPYGIVFGRSFFGFVFLMIFAIWKKEKLFDSSFPFLFFILIALINNTIPWTLIPFSQEYISTGLASILNALTPLMTIIVGMVFFKTKLVKKQYVGVFIGLVGIFILIDLPSIFNGGNQLIGAILLIMATIMYATSNHLTKKFLSEVSVIQLSLYTMFFTALMSFIITIISGQKMNVFLHLDNVAIFVGLGVFGSGVAYLLYYFMIQKGSAEFASLVTYLVPISAIMWGIIFLEEQITIQMIIGLVVIFSGVYISTTVKKTNDIEITEEREGA